MACGTRALHSTIGTADTDASRMQFEKKGPLQRQTGGKTRFVFSSACFSRGSRSVRTFFAAGRSAKQEVQQASFPATSAGEDEKARAPLHSSRRGSTNVTDLLGGTVHSARMIIFCTFPAVSISFSTLRQDCPRPSRAAFPPMRC